MPPAVIAAAIVGTGAVASAAIGSSATKKAANASNDAAQTSVDAQNRALDLQQQNSATQRAVGDSALNALAGRFGLSTPTAQQSATVAAPKAGDPNWDAYIEAHPDLKAALTGPNANQFAGNTLEEKAADHYARYGKEAGWEAPTYTADTLPATPAAPTPTVDAQGNYTAPRPIVGTAPTFQAPTLGTAPTYQAPALGVAPTYQAPNYRETQVAPLDVSVGNYQQSPDYQFQLDQGNANITNNAAVTGTLGSGAALKALQKYGQDLALGDYSQWRSYATNQYNTDRADTRSQDAQYNGFNTTQAQNTYNADNTAFQFGAGYNQANALNSYNAANNAFQYGSNYAQNNALNAYNAANSQYQYGTNLSQTNYNSDRDYTTGQYNANTNALLGLAGNGASATSANNNAIGKNANALSSLYTSNANTQGNAALANAGLVSGAVNTGVNALAYYYGNQGSAAKAGTYGPTA